MKPRIHKRNYPRFNVKYPVLFDFFGASRKGLIVNLSKTGLFIACGTLPDPGHLLNLSCQLGQHLPNMSLAGRVIWCRSGFYTVFSQQDPRGAGIHLINPPETYIELIHQFQEIAENDERVEDRIKTRHRIMYKSSLEFVAEYCEDLSHGGMYLATNALLPEGDIIQLKLELPGTAQPLEITAKVVHTLSELECQHLGKPPGLGLQFLDLTGESMRLIKQYLQHLKLYRLFDNKIRQPSLPQSGQLQDYLVAELFLDFIKQKRSDVLRINTNTNQWTLFFNNGDLIYVDSNKHEDTFDGYLLRNALFNEHKWEQLNYLLKHRPLDPQRDFETRSLLSASHEWTQAEINHHWAEFQTQLIAGLLREFEGSFLAQRSIDYLPQAGLPALNTWDLLYKGVTTAYSKQLLYAWLGISDNAVIGKTDTAVTASLDAKSTKLLHYFNQPHTLQQCCQDTAIDEKSALAIIFLSFLSGWLQLQHLTSSQPIS